MDCDSTVKCSSVYSKLPSMTNAVRQSDSKDAQKILIKGLERLDLSCKNSQEDTGDGFGQITVKQEPMDADDSDGFQQKMEFKEVGKQDIPVHYFKAKSAQEILSKFEAKDDSSLECISEIVVNELASCHGKFIKELSTFTTTPCLSAISQLCHRSTMLAHRIWVDLFPRIWDLLEDKHQAVLAGEMGPFLCSGSHLHQGDCYRSSINTFVEGMANCTPAIPIRPAVLKYLGKTHNLWHRSALLLEEAAVACEDMLAVNPQLHVQQPWLDFGMQSL